MVKQDIYTKPDLHVHSTCSDGTDKPEELITRAREMGVNIFALTDHDAVNGCTAAMAAHKPGDPAFLCGIELSCRDKEGKYHILGYGYDPSARAILDTVDEVRRIRFRKMMGRFQFLKDDYHFTFDQDDLDSMVGLNNPGKPHFANLLLEKGYVQNLPEAYDILNRYHGTERKLLPEEAIRVILESGGIPVLAHGILGDGGQKLTAEEIGERIDRLVAMGIRGMECYYSLYTQEQQQIMLALAEKHHLLVTAGSDYHGKLKPVKMGETHMQSPERLIPFYEAVSEKLLR